MEASGGMLGMVVVFVAAAFTDNILLTRFLGMCSCLGVSRKVDTSVGLGLAVVFVTTCTALINYAVYHFLLIPLGLEFLKLAVFIMTIAAFVQFVEMVLEKASPPLYYSLGIFLPLITVNCAILGISLFMLNQPFSMLQALAYGAGGGFGWFVAIVLLGGIRERVNEASLPKGLAGPGITLIIIGILSLGFVGFSGMIR